MKNDIVLRKVNSYESETFLKSVSIFKGRNFYMLLWAKEKLLVFLLLPYFFFT